MKSTARFYKTKFVLSAKIGLIGLVAYVSLNSAQAHQEGKAVAQQAFVNQSLQCYPRRSKNELLDIIADQKHTVSFYNSTGSSQTHISPDGKIKLTKLGKTYKKMEIKMKHEVTNGWDLEEKVKTRIRRKRTMLGDIITLKAWTYKGARGEDTIRHHYRFEFYVPCHNHVDGRHFIFDFFDIDRTGRPTIRAHKNGPISGSVGLKSHSRGTGGGRSN